ncbi:2-dehydropantoate 2-reductase [Herbaspirillum sp.]|uniref:ketopantoate reductase family protein n=2 Tax=unclassified Herbaspirillum TaxID=2624150 RepID=UPI000C0B5A56|nr:2-dehydropantoate 2-reductase [Herbaspirillum sp.]MAF01095.1 2-dehydropantoate 2-reductase [Herbaspirillum sp.]MBO15510.1 2-dehydropantoate 2-reductase [Herbaspirillum sp.]|tara:strand:+ start:5178 stop:6071 length:894 start_codon:yes stop_codon:yes gene_type:complete
MKVAVMGAGAVGCYFAGMLARAGHDVVLVGRPQHVEAFNTKGLRLEAKTFDETLPVEASTDPAIVAGADLVLFCVKSPDTETAGAQLRPYLAPDTLVLTLQNGTDNAERLRTVIPQPVSAAVVYVATEMAGPGHVKHHGRGELVIEPAARSQQAAEALIAAGVPTEISENVRGALWLKLIINCAYNALSAVTQLPYGKLVEGVGVLEVMGYLVSECKAVAAAEGVTLAGDVDVAIRKIIETMPTQFSSTAQDVARRKPSEIDHLNGYIVRRGQAHGIATPVNLTVHALVKLIESKAR